MTHCCVSLWRAVIYRAILDSMYNKKVYNWFDLKNRDFLIVCDFANLNASTVIQCQRMKYKRYRPDSYEYSSVNRLLNDIEQEVEGC